ncbi:DUF4190 domain-containing protein [Nocardioides sp. SYSU DS0663]|uniref:DUF4190 domain-containing protein n=1 Tax=Nocardioides sp. SYSU DS0663 TaxID=3416445 RepID=UPI003F4B54A3
MSYPDPPPPPPGSYGGGGTPYGNGPSQGGMREHPRGTTILILGILSIVCCGLFTGIPAIAMGRSATAEIDARPHEYSNAGTVKAGYICGIIGTALSVLGLLLWIVVAVLGVASSSAAGF